MFNVSIMATFLLAWIVLSLEYSVASDVSHSRGHNTRSQTGSSPLEIVVSQLSQRMDALEAENQALKTENQALQAENQAMKQTQTASENKMNLMETEVNMLFNQLQSSRSDVHKLTMRVADLETDHQSMNLTVVNVEIENQALVQNFSQLKADSVAMVTQTARVQTDVETVKADSNVIRHELETLRQDNANVKTDLTSKINAAARSVSFHAQLSGRVYQRGEILTADHVFTNDGGAFTPSTGIFKTPVSGTYIFLANTATDSDNDHRRDVVAEITVDHSSVGQCTSQFTDHENQGSCHAVLILRVGQKVWLENVYGNSDYFTGTLPTTFSGALLHADTS